jgi:integrase
MQTKFNFTEKSIAAIPAPKVGRLRVYDSKVPGLCCLIQSSNHRAYGWFRKVGTTAKYIGIGETASTSLTDARMTAESFNQKLFVWKAQRFAGADPFAKPEAPTTTTPTFEQTVSAYVANHVRAHAKNPTRTEYDIRLWMDRPLANWKNRPVDAITVDDVLTVKNAFGKAHTAANRTVQFIRRVLNWASRTKDGKVNFWKCANPAEDISMFKEEQRTRYLGSDNTHDELNEFNAALDDEENIDLRDFLILSMWTGARRGSILSMRWENINFIQKTWYVPAPKNGKPYSVQLLADALTVLKRRRTEVPSSSPFVFPSDSKTGHLMGVKRAWADFRDRVGLHDFRVHDLRHSHASFLAMSGASLPTIAAALGHESLQSTKRYAHLCDSTIRSAREQARKKMLSMMKASKELQTNRALLPRRVIKTKSGKAAVIR